jgi:pimeloyl-ACP methyl ester carboxylesterase
LPVPAALIWGLGDHFLPAGSLEFFRANLPDAPTLLLKRCGHLPQRERPLPVLRFIRRFAAQLANAPIQSKHHRIATKSGCNPPPALVQ